MLRFSIYRFDPDKDKKPYMQDYQLEESSLAGRQMLLDAILLLKEQDDSLAFRRSCREGVCGSDAMNINGSNGLACITPLSSLKQPITLRPLPGMLLPGGQFGLALLTSGLCERIADISVSRRLT